MLEALLAVAAVVAPRVAVEGDPIAAEFVRARLTAAGIAIAAVDDADVRVRVRALENGRIHVVVDDRKGTLADRIVQEADDAETRVAAWDIVRDAVDRYEQPAVAHEDAEAPFAVDALVAVAPDPTFGATSYFPVGADVSLRFDVTKQLAVVAGAGYDAGLQAASSLHALAIHAGAEVRSTPADVEWAAGARATTTPSLAVAAQKAGVGVAGGIGASVTAYGRALLSMASFDGARVYGVVEAGVEARLVRESVLADKGTSDESLFALPIAVGVEVRWP